MTYDTRTDAGFAHITDYALGDEYIWLAAKIERSAHNPKWTGLTLNGPEGEVAIEGYAAVKALRDLCDRALAGKE